MQEFRYVVTDEEGIHARPAGKLAKMAKLYQSGISITKDEKTAELKKIMTLLSLGIKKGDEILVRVSGEDEEKAAKEIRNFFHENL